MNKLRGFTLIELMVAIGLTGLVAVGAYQTFDQAVRASGGAQERAAQVNRLDRSWRLLEKDLQHAIPRQNVSASAFQAPADAFYGQRVNTGHFDESESDLRAEPLTLENPLGQPWFLKPFKSSAQRFTRCRLSCDRGQIMASILASGKQRRYRVGFFIVGLYSSGGHLR